MLDWKLGWTSGTGTYAITEGNNVPTWVYIGHRYWVMNLIDNNGSKAISIYSNYIGNLNIDNTYSVRPVINLYKSAIPTT